MKPIYIYLHMAVEKSSRETVYDLSAAFPEDLSSFGKSCERVRAASTAGASDGSVESSSTPPTAAAIGATTFARKELDVAGCDVLPSSEEFNTNPMKSLYDLFLKLTETSRLPYGIYPTHHLKVGMKTSTKNMCPLGKNFALGLSDLIQMKHPTRSSGANEETLKFSSTKFSNNRGFFVRPNITPASTYLPTRLNLCLKFRRSTFEGFRIKEPARGTSCAARDQVTPHLHEVDESGLLIRLGSFPVRAARMNSDRRQTSSSRNPFASERIVRRFLLRMCFDGSNFQYLTSLREVMKES